MRKSIYITVKTISIILTVAAVAVTLFCAFLLFCSIRNMEVPALGPFRIYVVLSDSMVPIMRTDDAIIVRSVDAQELSVGDIITFNAFETDTVITHRIEEKNTDEEYGGYVFVTKGDNNNVVDGFLTPESRVIGRYMLRLPQLGSLISNARGNPFYVAVPVLVLIAVQFLLGKAEANLDPRKRNGGKQENPQEETSA